jgi:hypothetical protein
MGEAVENTTVTRLRPSPDFPMTNAPFQKIKLSADLPRLRAALEEAHGNISRAAQALGITKPWAMELVRRNALNEWARDLREKNGQGSTGYPRGLARPRKIKTAVTTSPAVAV